MEVPLGHSRIFRLACKCRASACSDKFALLDHPRTSTGTKLAMARPKAFATGPLREFKGPFTISMILRRRSSGRTTDCVQDPDIEGKRIVICQCTRILPLNSLAGVRTAGLKCVCNAAPANYQTIIWILLTLLIMSAWSLASLTTVRLWALTTLKGTSGSNDVKMRASQRRLKYHIFHHSAKYHMTHVQSSIGKAEPLRASTQGRSGYFKVML